MTRRPSTRTACPQRLFTHKALSLCDVILRAGLLLSLLSWATTVSARPIPPPAWDHCLRHYAEDMQLDADVFRAIIYTESANHPYAFGWTDANGLRHTMFAESHAAATHRLRSLLRTSTNFDVGLGQVNVQHFARLSRHHHIQPLDLLDPCTNLYASHIILQDQTRLHGQTWQAIAGYNGSPQYLPLVWTNLCRVASFEDCPSNPSRTPRRHPPGPESPLFLTRHQTDVWPIVDPRPVRLWRPALDQHPVHTALLNRLLLWVAGLGSLGVIALVMRVLVTVIRPFNLSRPLSSARTGFRTGPASRAVTFPARSLSSSERDGVYAYDLCPVFVPAQSCNRADRLRDHPPLVRRTRSLC